MNQRRLKALIGFGLGLAIMCAPPTVRAATVVVNPDESIQDALDAASPGDTVVVMPGTYQETHGGENALTVNKDGIRLVGRVRNSLGEAGKVKLVPGPGNESGISAEGASAESPLQGFTVRGFTVEGFAKHGIVTRYVNDFKIDRNESINNLENGIFPTLSANGLVKRNLSYGSLDTSLWVEASENVRVLRNVVHSSPTGIEVTVSNNVTIRGNEAYGNAVGIGLYHPNAASLPPIAQMANWKVERNHVHDNNGPNNAPPGSLSADLPIGGGILLLGVDESVMKNNRIENNDFFGIAVVDWCLAQSFGDFNCDDNPPIVEPYPENNLIVGNQLINNGTNPPPHPAAVLASDLVFFATGDATGNCFKRNSYSTSVPGSLPDDC
jgi:parallel beta-helix repeat protein